MIADAFHVMRCDCVAHLDRALRVDVGFTTNREPLTCLLQRPYNTGLNHPLESTKGGNYSQCLWFILMISLSCITKNMYIQRWKKSSEFCLFCFGNINGNQDWLELQDFKCALYLNKTERLYYLHKACWERLCFHLCLFICLFPT